MAVAYCKFNGTLAIVDDLSGVPRDCLIVAICSDEQALADAVGKEAEFEGDPAGETPTLFVPSVRAARTKDDVIRAATEVMHRIAQRLKEPAHADHE